jgi:hypothetical protein
MSNGEPGTKELDASQRLDSVLTTVKEILSEIGVTDVTPDSVIAATGPYDGPILIPDTDRFNRFSGLFALRVRFVGYALNDAAFLTVRQFCEMYVRESYPEIPRAPMSDAQYERRANGEPKRAATLEKDFPICFVLGCGRSGTTLLRTILNVHDDLWAPGELHLANFEGMADRAANIAPVLRDMPIPEVAARMGESIAPFSNTFRTWEIEDVPIPEVYQHLHDADPDTLIVDKTPTYSGSLEDLERISRMLPNARFVHLVRNPHDVIRSLVRMQLYKGVQESYEPGLNPYQIAEAIWTLNVSNIERFLSDVPAERKCTVRYEELVSDAEPPLRRICDLLDRAYDPAMANPYGRGSRRIARGAGDPQINFLKRVEKRTPTEALYPLGMRCRTLANRYRY